MVILRQALGMVCILLLAAGDAPECARTAATGRARAAGAGRASRTGAISGPASRPGSACRALSGFPAQPGPVARYTNPL